LASIEYSPNVLSVAELMVSVTSTISDPPMTLTSVVLFGTALNWLPIGSGQIRNGGKN
jgi:hypothetical protein